MKPAMDKAFRALTLSAYIALICFGLIFADIRDPDSTEEPDDPPETDTAVILKTRL